MHFEILVEDESGRIAIESILQNILGKNHAVHSWRMFSYKGLGRIPNNLHATKDPNKRILLDRLPKLLRGYGRSLPQPSAVIVVVDLDDKDCTVLKQDLLNVLKACDPQPNALFRIAIEESEAWLLGDRNAVKAAYPRARDAVLDGLCTGQYMRYVGGSGGRRTIQAGRCDSRGSGYHETGKAKCEWAEKIARHMDMDKNRSKSFQVFRDGVRNLAAIS